MTAAPDLGVVFDLSPNAYMVIDRELRYVAANESYLRAVGRRRDELLGNRLLELFPHDPDDPDNESARRLAASFERVFTTGQPDALPLIHYRIGVDRPGGPVYEDRYWSATHTPLAADDGRVTLVLQHTSDVTEMIRARRKAEAAQAELEAIFESFPEALYAGDAGGIKRANAVARDLLGYETVEEVPRPPAALVAELAPRRSDTGEPVAAEQSPFDRALRGLATRMEVVIRHGRTREERVIFSSGAPIRLGGMTTGAVVTHIDITEQKRAQAEAVQLAKVLDATRDFVGIADRSGRPIFVNEAALALVGLPDLETACRRQVVDYFVERQRAHVADEVIPSALRDGYWEGELLFLHQVTGEEIPVLYTIFPLRDPGGAVTALATITRDLRRRKAAEAERAELLEKERAARAQAEQANLLKDQFLATVSHELRTPLTSMLGWLQLLRSGALAPDRRAHGLEIVERNARVQAQLIEDLLDVSRIVSNKLVLDMEPLDLVALVGTAVENVRPAAEAKGIHLDVSVESAALVKGDPRRMQQVVGNLLSNAVKFTPQGGWVLVEVTREGSTVEIAVTDSGCGIPPGFLPHVFERFRQAEGGVSRSMGGLGLGLSIARHLVEAQGGEIAAFSGGDGTGARFTVRLPIAPTPAALDAAVGPEFEPAAELEGLHILVVDDEEDTVEYVRTLLRRCKAKVTVAATAAEALRALQRERPDLLLSDIGLRQEDGYHLIQRIRALPPDSGGQTPAVALAACPHVEDRMRVMRAGFQNHVAKPIEPGELLAVVAALAGRSADHRRPPPPPAIAAKRVDTSTDG